MASSSSSKFRRSYDVFLSFKGTDICNYFLNHFYRALVQSGINSYIGSEDLEKGEQISPALMEAIEESQIAIVLFSKDYASSPWCLEEVAKIMECKEQRGLMVFLVFYKVEPGEVRGQRQGYAEAMAKHEVKFGKDSEKIRRWKKALLDIGSLSRWYLMDGYEARLIQNIVQEMSTQLGRMPLNVAKYPVGTDSRVQEIQTILNLQSKDDILMVGLLGQGGIGKTTLAKAIYNTIFREFQGSSFLGQVREQSKSVTGLVHLQKNLLLQVLQKEVTIFSVGEGRQLIQDRLCNKKVLIILDDVDYMSQLKALASDYEWFGKGSRIFITTRNKGLLTSHGVDHLYEVNALNYGEALELFRKYAFPKSQKIEIRSDLVDRVLHHAKGLPLALEVLGSLLCGRGEHQWKSALNRLAKHPNETIFDVLKASYDGLEDYVKEIFLDIACFFKGWRTWDVKKVLDSCGFPVTIGFKILFEHSLISEENGTLQMHDLVELMGKEVVREACRDDPGKSSRLWLYDDVLDVLSSDKGTAAIKAIVLRLPKQEEMYIGPNAFTNMRKLRLLILHNINNSFQGPIHLPNELRWFEWPNCASIPEFRYGPKKLVGLDMQNTKTELVLKQFEKYHYSQIPLEYRNVFSGGEMPKQFVPVEDGTISFMASQDLYGKFLGLVLCVVFSVENEKKEISFDIVPHVNGQRRNGLSGTLGPFDSDHVWIQYFQPNVLWGMLEGVVDHSRNDKSYLQFSLRVRVSTGIIKKLGYVIRCRQLEDDLKAVLEGNQLVNPASLCEDYDDSTDSEKECLFIREYREPEATKCWLAALRNNHMSQRNN